MKKSSLVIETSKLCKSYHRGWLRSRSLKALTDVDLSVARGEVFALLGPNGAGKTTLVKLLLGILRPSSGKAAVLGQPAGSMAARMKIGYLPENLVFPKHLTALGALFYYGRLSRLTDTKIKSMVPGLLDLVGLAGRETESVRKYSKGMRQRLGLAQSLLHEPEILVMDEPTDGLDPLGRSQIRELIETLKQQGKTIFLNSHILQEVELISDRVAILANGTLRAIGAIPELIESHSHGKRLRVQLKCRSADPYIIDSVRTLQFDDSVLSFQSTSPLEFAIHLETTDQKHIDHLVDRLRVLNISLLNLERHRIRLEDVFMQLVEDPQLLDETPSSTL